MLRSNNLVGPRVTFDARFGACTPSLQSSLSIIRADVVPQEIGLDILVPSSSSLYWVDSEVSFERGKSIMDDAVTVLVVAVSR